MEAGEPNQYLRKFRNGCLVILPCRVGMSKIETCYIEPIRFIFYQPNIVMGAMGGKPDQALYFVGLQRDELIFLDPHFVQESVKHEDGMYDDWENCEMLDEEEMPTRQELERMHRNQKKGKKMSRIQTIKKAV